MDILLLIIMSLLIIFYLWSFLSFKLFLIWWKNIVGWTVFWKKWIFSRWFTWLLWTVTNWTRCRRRCFSPWCQKNICVNTVYCFIMCCTLDFMIFLGLLIRRYNTISIFFRIDIFEVINIFRSLFLRYIDDYSLFRISRYILN